jgi:hypothetical protein
MRTILPLALIVLVLLGAWWIWPQAEPRALVRPTPDAVADTPARPLEDAAQVEAAAPATERAVAGEPAAAGATRSAQLVVLCLVRGEQRPIAGVRVYARYVGEGGGYGRVGSGRNSTGAPGEELLSGSDGRATFSVQAGRALSVSADDLPHFVSQEGAQVPALAAGETREVALAHDAGEHAHYCGIVVAHEGGAPVSGAQVSIEGTPRTQTDAAGRFELDFAAHMPPWIRVDAAGYSPALASADAGHERVDLARRIELLRPATLEIALLSGGDEARLRVALRGDARRLAQEGVFTSVWRGVPALVYEADADSSGVCRFADLPPGVGFDAQVLGSSGVLFRNAEPLVLQAGEQRRVEWDLGGAAIAGRVLESNGEPAAGIELWLLRGGSDHLRYVELHTLPQEVASRATSGADGGFRFLHVSPGTWILSPKPTEEISGLPQKVVVEPGAREVTVEVRLARGIFVRGRLVAPDGQKGVQGYVYLVGPLRGGVNTEPDGTFVLGPLARDGVFLVGNPYNDYRDSEPMHVEAPAEGVILRTRPGAEVAGRVVDEFGNGAQSSITAAFADGGMTRTRTREDGSFRLTGLGASSCTLFASTSDGRAGMLEEVALSPEHPATDPQLVLRPGATLRVSWQGSGVGQFHFKSGRASIAGDGLQPGETRTQVVPPGRVTVECAGPARGDKQQQELDLAAGETRELVFKAPAGK